MIEVYIIERRSEPSPPAPLPEREGGPAQRDRVRARGAQAERAEECKWSSVRE
jgi:hypothetical protein